MPFFVLIFKIIFIIVPKDLRGGQTPAFEDVDGGHYKSLGGADAGGSLAAVSPWGGFNLMVLKKPVTWPGTSAKTL